MDQGWKCVWSEGSPQMSSKGKGIKQETAAAIVGQTHRQAVRMTDSRQTVAVNTKTSYLTIFHKDNKLIVNQYQCLG